MRALVRRPAAVVRSRILGVPVQGEQALFSLTPRAAVSCAAQVFDIKAREVESQSARQHTFARGQLDVSKGAALKEGSYSNTVDVPLELQAPFKGKIMAKVVVTTRWTGEGDDAASSVVTDMSLATTDTGLTAYFNGRRSNGGAAVTVDMEQDLSGFNVPMPRESQGGNNSPFAVTAPTTPDALAAAGSSSGCGESIPEAGHEEETEQHIHPLDKEQLNQTPVSPAESVAESSPVLGLTCAPARGDEPDTEAVHVAPLPPWSPPPPTPIRLPLFPARDASLSGQAPRIPPTIVMAAAEAEARALAAAEATFQAAQEAPLPEGADQGPVHGVHVVELASQHKEELARAQQAVDAAAAEASAAAAAAASQSASDADMIQALNGQVSALQRELTAVHAKSAAEARTTSEALQAAQVAATEADASRVEMQRVRRWLAATQSKHEAELAAKDARIAALERMHGETMALSQATSATAAASNSAVQALQRSLDAEVKRRETAEQRADTAWKRLIASTADGASRPSRAATQPVQLQPQVQVPPTAVVTANSQQNPLVAMQTAMATFFGNIGNMLPKI